MMTEPVGPGAFATVVVGTDGSPDAQQAMLWTAEISRRIGASVVVVHAIGLLEHLPDGGEVVSSSIRDEIHDLLRSSWTGPLRSLGVEHECVMEEGPPLMAIPRVAARVDAGFIVVASHGAGSNPAGLLGSTSPRACLGLIGAGGDRPEPIRRSRWRCRELVVGPKRFGGVDRGRAAAHEDGH